MNLLADTHIVLWAAAEPKKLSKSADALLGDDDNNLYFSAASIWEVAIKAGLGRKDFQVDPRLLRRGLLDNGWRELVVTSEHAAALVALPTLHKDPFDRMLVAQASEEGMLLVTTDELVSQYPGPVRQV